MSTAPLKSAPLLLLDPALNHPPARINHAHLVGIAGVGMAALAGMLQDAGLRVSGSDEQIYPPMSDYLAALKIPTFSGYSPRNLEFEGAGPDLVVVGNAIRATNPEAQALAVRRIPYLSMPQALSHYFISGKRSLVVAGTHGKTTTASLLATMLDHAGFAPGFMIGGIVKAFGRSSRLGGGACFVSEGDEYDTAFFDKGPKFLHYRPETCIVTGVEFDHADIFADLEAVKAAFARLLTLIPADGLLVACLDDPVLRELVSCAPCRVLGYGQSAGLHWRLRDLAIGPDLTRFKVERQGRFFGEFVSRMPGRHNALNALAVIAVLADLAVPVEKIASSLASFEGVRRRQEIRGVEAGVTVIDDFAHHPTAVRETLLALRSAYPDRRLLAVFEPRTNSSRRRVFQRAYAEVFAPADRVLIREPEGLEKLAEDQRFSVARLVADLVEGGQDAVAYVATEEIIADLASYAKPGDVVVILSNGGFDNIHQRLLEQLTNPPNPL